MSDSCPKCYDSKKDCRCTLCTVCEADIGPESNQLKIIFKRKKMFCRYVVPDCRSLGNIFRLDFLGVLLHCGMRWYQVMVHAFVTLSYIRSITDINKTKIIIL